MALRPDGVAVECRSGSPETFAARVSQAVAKDLAVILLCDDPGAMEAGLKAAEGTRPLIYAQGRRSRGRDGRVGQEARGPAGGRAPRTATWRRWPPAPRNSKGRV